MKALFFILFSVALTGCGYIGSQADYARKEIGKFHASFNAGDYEMIYANSSTSFKCLVDADTFVALLESLRAELGNYVSGDFQSSISKAGITDAFAEIVILSQFEHGTAKEAFKYVFERDGYKLGNYVVRRQDEESASADVAAAPNRDPNVGAAPGRDPHIENGPHVTAETSRRIACDSSIVTIREDETGEPMSIGRRSRAIPPPMRRALRARDQGCRFPGCTNTRFVDGHHIKHSATY